MAEGIFLLQGDGSLVEMFESEYDSEAVLQKLLASYPHLLPGQQMNSAAPRRWLLICREMSLPDELEGGGRWSVDHLFLDQDGIPTLVEVKRSKDTRIRREVVGQMLDYAANAVLYWPVETIKARFEARCAAEGLVALEELSQHCGVADDADFWASVKNNLQAGKVRMIFVADIIPQELQRVVEFLNGQMDPAEVLAVEVRQFAGKELKTFVPRLIGQTAQAQQKKQGGSSLGRGEKWTWERFKADMSERNSSQIKPAEEILEWATRSGLRLDWGRGKTLGSFVPIVDHQGEWYAPIIVYSTGQVEVQFQFLKSKVPFSDEGVRLEFADRLNKIPGVQIGIEKLQLRPSFPLDRLADEQAKRIFFDTLNWFVSKIQSTV